MPWQQLVLEEGCKVDAAGQFRNRRIGLLAPRQNGKSAVMRWRVLGGLFLWGETWISMAQNRSLALEQFEQAMTVIESTDWLRAKVKRISKTNGKEALELKTGEKWMVVAGTKEGPRGYTGNLWIDELREITPAAYGAATPITRAVRNPQQWYTSNAGEEHSTVLNNIRQHALAGNAPGTAWLEWSADPVLAQVNPLDPELWYQANPSLGHFPALLADLELASKTDDPAKYRTESLCLWVDVIDSPWPFGKWDDSAVTSMDWELDRPTYFGIDVTPSRDRADLVAAQLIDGKIHVALVETWKHDASIDVRQIASDVAEILRQYSGNAAGVGFESWGARAVASELRKANVNTIEVTGRAFHQACDETLSAMSSGRLAHMNQTDLTAHMNACARKTVGDGAWTIVRRQSVLPISAAYAMVVAVHLASNEPGGTVDFIAV